MGTMKRVALILAAVIATATPRATFAQPAPSSGDPGTAGKEPTAKLPSAVRDAARNAANTAREATSMAKDVAQGAVRNTRQAAQDAGAAAKRAGHAKQKRDAPPTTPPSPTVDRQP